METKHGHTPDYWSGKWTMSDQGQVLRESDGRTVAVVYTDEKDTMLIAAAPELLAALEETVAILDRVFSDGSINNDDGTPRYDEYDLAEWREVIRKATGEE